MKKIVILFVSLIVCLSSSYAKADHSTEHPDVNGWGFDISFGNQAYMEHSTRISILTPHLFRTSEDISWRLTADYIGRKLQILNDTRLSEFALSLESNSRIYKDLVYSFTKFGVSMWSTDDSVYNDDLISMPLSFGLQVIVRKTNRMVMSYFVDYRFSLFSNFNNNVTPLSEENLLSGSTSFGLRMTF